jgi:hypothetical protein
MGSRLPHRHSPEIACELLANRAASRPFVVTVAAVAGQFTAQSPGAGMRLLTGPRRRCDQAPLESQRLGLGLAGHPNPRNWACGDGRDANRCSRFPEIRGYRKVWRLWRRIETCLAIGLSSRTGELNSGRNRSISRESSGVKSLRPLFPVIGALWRRVITC